MLYPKPTLPMIIFYVKENPLYNKEINYDEEYKRNVDELTRYHYKYGQYGFLSEKTYLEDIPNKSKIYTERKIKLTEVPYEMHKCGISPENYMETIETIENEPGFVRWWKPLEEHIE